MTYKYSICHPHKPDIEYPEKVLSKEEVREMAENYPWKKVLDLMTQMKIKEIHYNPSLDFTHITDSHSLCFTGGLENDNISFSLWYNRPVIKKNIFGRKKEKLEVEEKWNIDLNTGLEQLDLFLSQDYEAVEKFMTE